MVLPEKSLIQEDKTADLDQPRVPSNSTEATQGTSGALLTFHTDNIWNCWLPGAPREKKSAPSSLLKKFFGHICILIEAELEDAMLIKFT